MGEKRDFDVSQAGEKASGRMRGGASPRAKQVLLFTVPDTSVSLGALRYGMCSGADVR